MKTKILYWASLLSYFVALSAPAIILKYDEGWPNESLVWYGYNVLASGFLGVFVGQFAWFSNITLVVVLMLINSGKYRAGMYWAAAGFILGLQSLQLHTFYRNEGGDEYIVDYLGIAFYFWETSFALMALYCFSVSMNKSIVVIKKSDSRRSFNSLIVVISTILLLASCQLSAEGCFFLTLPFYVSFSSSCLMQTNIIRFID
ncbi:MAG: hypothetical protein WC101_01555 [Candidatus Gracilibacteria bacterium]